MREKFKYILWAVPIIFSRKIASTLATFGVRQKLYRADEIHRKYADELYRQLDMELRSGDKERSENVEDLERSFIVLYRLKLIDKDLYTKITATSERLISELERKLGRKFAYHGRAAIRIRVKEKFYKRPLTANERAYILHDEYRHAHGYSKWINISKKDFVGTGHYFAEFDKDGNWTIFAADKEHEKAIRRNGHSFYRHATRNYSVRHSRESFLPPFIFASEKNYHEGYCEIPPGWSIEQMKVVLRDAQLEVETRKNR